MPVEIKNISDHLNSFSCMNGFKGFKIMGLNIRSLLPKMDVLRLELSEVGIDAIVLNEVWLKPRIDADLVVLNGYQFYRAGRSMFNPNGGP